MTKTQFAVNVLIGMPVGIAAGILLVIMLFQLVLAVFGIGMVWSFTLVVLKPLLCGVSNVLCVTWFLRENIAKNVFGLP